MNTEEKNAEQRIVAAFLELLKEKPYRNIKVTAICRTAMVHRSTFYRLFEDVTALFNTVCFSYVRKVLTDDRRHRMASAEDMRDYMERCFTRIRDNAEDFKLLCGPNGNAGLPYLLGSAIKERQVAIAAKIGMKDPLIGGFIQLLPEYVAMYMFIRLFPEMVYAIDEDYQNFDYDLNETVTENTKRYLALHFKGNPEFHDMLFAATVVLQTKTGTYKSSVTDLLETAGISRTEFYLYYKNIDDFHRRFFRSVFSIAEAFLYSLCVSPPLTEEETKKLDSTDFKNYILRAAQMLFEQGDLTKYVACVIGNLNLRMVATVKKNLAKEELTYREEMVVRYVISRISFATAYYMMGTYDYPAYLAAVEETKPFRKILGIVKE